MMKIIYNNDLLKSLCDDNNIKINENYFKTKINRDTKIIGDCISKNCKNNFNRTFRNLYNSKNFCCNTCTKNLAKIKAKKSFLNKYGVDNPMKLNETKEKIKNNLINNYGVQHQMLLQKTKNKIKDTCILKYGVVHPLKNNDIKNKCKKTCLENYGTEYLFQSNTFKEKNKETCLEKYGTEYLFQSNTFKEKNKEICLEKYGVEYQSQRSEIKEKIKQTNLINYGVNYPLQNIEIMEKSSRNAYKLKDYIMPSGKIIKCQGYEHYAIDELLKNEGILETDIILGAKNVPNIWYVDANNKEHKHYVDIFIPNQNKCIEVKSTWTLKKNKDNVFLKQNAGKLLGYDYEIWVYNNKGKKVDCFI